MKHRKLSPLFLCTLPAAALALLGACASQAPTPPSALHYSIPDQPEGASAYTQKQAVSSRRWMVAAANPLATDAGYQVLKAGGSAVDAAVAVQMVLTLVEPQSSGIGGGAFLLHYRPPGSRGAFDARTVQAYDGREVAPAAADERLFMQPDGKPMPFMEAVVGGRAVGVPGTVHMLETAHKVHGKLPWAELFTPAITLAEQGFRISPRLHTLLEREQHLRKDAMAASYFYAPSGAPWPVGHVLKNPELAGVLRALAAQGAIALHTGEIAQAIVDKVQKHPTNPGKLALQDLASYKTRIREGFCTDYPTPLKTYALCGFPPPSSGAIAVAQILGMNRPDAKTMDTDFLHHYTEAARLAFADRAQYVADPDFVQPPAGSWSSLTAPRYLASRAALIAPQSMKTAQPGVPPGTKTTLAPMPMQIEHGTSHISIVDGYGNALAMTTTIEDGFGARQMVNRGKGLSGGFLLNNELTDFSFAPTDATGAPIANRVQSGKRPRSSMSPTLVFDRNTGAFVASVGSPGGALIIHYTAKTLYGMLNMGLDPQEAINLPNFGSLNGPTLLEEKRFSPEVVDVLKKRDHTVRELNMTSGLQGILKTPTGYIGGADPRREGVVLGE